jgi:hypothetical protein
MNKERYNQIINEAYENYCKSFDTQSEIESHSFDTDPMTKIMFVEKIKNFDWFSEKWGLKIEERELSDDELNIFNLFKQNPTKLITLKYKDTILESYE